MVDRSMVKAILHTRRGIKLVIGGSRPKDAQAACSRGAHGSQEKRPPLAARTNKRPFLGTVIPGSAPFPRLLRGDDMKRSMIHVAVTIGIAVMTGGCLSAPSPVARDAAYPGSYPIVGTGQLSLWDTDGRRSEERRVGKECLRLCRSRWSPYH